MNALTRLVELLQDTARRVERTERLIKEYPDQTGFLIELKSLKKLLAQLEEESVTVTARLVGLDIVERDFRLEMEDGAVVEGKLAETMDSALPLQVPQHYQARLRPTRRRRPRSQKMESAFLLSDLTAVS